MTNGLIDGNTGIEGKLGTFVMLHTILSSHKPADALSINKLAYVPPHLRNMQRAASNPALSSG